MTSTILINLIVSIVAVGCLVVVLRAAHVLAGGRPDEVHEEERADSPYELERAA
jgi:hypothetical protein